MAICVGKFVIASPVLLAPMAGVTDLPFRRLARRFGVGLAVSEMVASREMVEAKPSVRARAEIEGDGAVQLAGREPRWMAEAARIAQDNGARLIDINFGCPAKKVTGGLSGAALMREPDRALRLIEAVAAAVDAPVSVKMRLGWDAVTAPAFAAMAESAGAAMITVHGRTRAQFYGGAADWRAVRAVVEAVRAPVIVNGDIVDGSTARAALAASGAAGVMIGRGAQGAPWTVAAVAADLAGARFAPPGLTQRRDLLIEHHEMILRFYGRDLGLRVARKHLGWALAREHGARALRDRVVRLDDAEAVRAALIDGFAVLADAAQGDMRGAEAASWAA